jgi:hypothetical protein
MSAGAQGNRVEPMLVKLQGRFNIFNLMRQTLLSSFELAAQVFEAREELGFLDFQLADGLANAVSVH